jgi:uncharacterized protein with PIN domain
MRRFLGDAMLGTLVTYLRMCGYDTAYALDRGVEADDALLEWARSEDRTLLTRNRRLADRAEDAIHVAAHEPLDQVRELREAGVELSLPAEPTRCSRCNGRLVEAGDEPRPDYAPAPIERPAWRCLDCGQFYWRGSHWADLADRLEAG